MYRKGVSLDIHEIIQHVIYPSHVMTTWHCNIIVLNSWNPLHVNVKRGLLLGRCHMGVSLHLANNTEAAKLATTDHLCCESTRHRGAPVRKVCLFYGVIMYMTHSLYVRFAWSAMSSPWWLVGMAARIAIIMKPIKMALAFQVMCVPVNCRERISKKVT